MTPDEARTRQKERIERSHVIEDDGLPEHGHAAEADLAYAIEAWEQDKARVKQLEGRLYSMTHAVDGILAMKHNHPRFEVTVRTVLTQRLAALRASTTEED